MFILCLIGFITAVLAGFAIFQKRNLGYWTRKNIPQLENTLLWGHAQNFVISGQPLYLYIRDYYAKAKALGYKYAGFNLTIFRTLLLIDPEIIKDVLTKNFDHFVNRAWYYNKRDDPLSANLLSLEGQEWYKIRTSISPTFTSSKMKLLFELVQDCGKLLETKIMELDKNKTTIDIKTVASSFTIDVIGRCAFGLECNTIMNLDSDFRKYTTKLLAPNLKRGVVHIIGNTWPNFARTLGLRTTPKDVSDFFIGSLKNTMDYRKKNNERRNDFLQLLMETSYNKSGISKPLTHEEVAANSMFFFIAGFETSSTTLNYCLYELAFFLETLRKYPPIPIVSRRCSKNYNIPGTKIVLEKDTKVLLPIYALHHDPEYFPDPEEFRPERFSDENKSQILPYTYLPFSEGPRNCVGYKFSYLETKIGLIYFLRNFKYTLNPKTQKKLAMLPSSFLLINKDMVYLDTEKVVE